MKSSRYIVWSCALAVVLLAGCQTATPPTKTTTPKATPIATISESAEPSITASPTPLGIEVTSSPMDSLEDTITESPEASASATGSLGLAAEGEFCGGIAGISCEDGLICQYEGDYPDAGGTCIMMEISAE